MMHSSRNDDWATSSSWGREKWDRPKDWGLILYTFLEANNVPWDVVSDDWHWHLNPLRNIAWWRDLFSSSFISSVSPGREGPSSSKDSTTSYVGICPSLRRNKSKCGRQIREGFYRYHPRIKALPTSSDVPDSCWLSLFDTAATSANTR